MRQREIKKGERERDKQRKSVKKKGELKRKTWRERE